MENLGLTRQQADELLEKNITDPVTKLHMIESEAIMQVLAKKFGEKEAPATAKAKAARGRPTERRSQDDG